MPQLDEIDIFSRDHMTVDKFDPQGNLIDRKIIFSTSSIWKLEFDLVNL